MQTHITTFRDLKVWKKAHEMTLSIYRTTQLFPLEEKFGITSQVRRSAYSVPSNIVEGYKRKGRKDFLHFLNIAETSLEETKYYILLSRDLNYIDKVLFLKLIGMCEEVGKMLFGLRKSLEV